VADQQDSSLKRIEQARQGIDPVFLDSPQFENDQLNAALGCSVVLKVEIINPIGSFKARGAYALVAQLSGRPHLVCATAGNFGQGLAHAARAAGLPITIFTAHDVSRIKLKKMRALGAEVRASSTTGVDAQKEAALFAASHAARLVEDGRDDAIADGAGTIAIELCRASRPVETVVVPVGDGALITGVARYLRVHWPRTRVVGVCAAAAPAFKRSFDAKRTVSYAASATLADGLAVSAPFDAAVASVIELADDVVLVEEQHIQEAVRLAHEHLGLVLEGAGASGLAAMVANPARFRGQRCATILTGNNISAEVFNALFAVGR
jgi:threonine dehydratase